MKTDSEIYKILSETMDYLKSRGLVGVSLIAFDNNGSKKPYTIHNAGMCGKCVASTHHAVGKILDLQFPVHKGELVNGNIDRSHIN